MIDDAAIAQVQANVRKRPLRALVARDHLESHDAMDMEGYAHGGGFSVDARARIEATDRAGLERLLRYSACPPLSWTGSSSAVLIWSTAAAKATASHSSPTNTLVNRCSRRWI